MSTFTNRTVLVPSCPRILFQNSPLTLALEAPHEGVQSMMKRYLPENDPPLALISTHRFVANRFYLVDWRLVVTSWQLMLQNTVERFGSRHHCFSGEEIMWLQ